MVLLDWLQQLRLVRRVRILLNAILALRRQAHWSIAVKKLLTAHFLHFDRLISSPLPNRLRLLNAAMLANLVFSLAQLANLLPAVALKLKVELRLDLLLAKEVLAQELWDSDCQ